MIHHDARAGEGVESWWVRWPPPSGSPFHSASVLHLRKLLHMESPQVQGAHIYLGGKELRHAAKVYVRMAACDSYISTTVTRSYYPLIQYSVLIQ